VLRRFLVDDLVPERCFFLFLSPHCRTLLSQKYDTERFANKPRSHHLRSRRLCVCDVGVISTMTRNAGVCVKIIFWETRKQEKHTHFSTHTLTLENSSRGTPLLKEDTHAKRQNAHSHGIFNSPVSPTTTTTGDTLERKNAPERSRAFPQRAPVVVEPANITPSSLQKKKNETKDSQHRNAQRESHT